MVRLRFSKRKTTFREYAVGNKNFHTATLVITVLTTAIAGGSMMRTIPYVYNYDIYYIFIVFLAAIKPILLISILSFRMGPFMNHLSISETIGSVYGRYPRAITALLSICICISLTSIEINIMSHVIRMCISSIDHRIITVMVALYLIAYTILGGVRAITISDIVQFLIFMTILFMIIKFLFIKTGKSLLEIILILKEEKKLQLNHVFQNNRKLIKLVIHFIGSFFYITPSVIHRLYMCCSPIQVYKVFSRVSILGLVIKGSFILIGLLIFIEHPNLGIKNFWLCILDHMSPAYRAFFLLCLLAMTMSSADSNLHTASIMVSHDMMEVIKGVKLVHYTHKILVAKLSIIVIGLLAIIPSVLYTDIFQLTKFIKCYAMKIFLITVVSPFILAVLGFRGSSSTALIGMVTAILFHFFFRKWISYNLIISWSNITILVNGFAMMAAHYILPQPPDKGWVKM